MDACYTINRKKKYFRIYNLDMDFPLEKVQEMKTQNDQTYQQVANALTEYAEDTKNET